MRSALQKIPCRDRLGQGLQALFDAQNPLVFDFVGVFGGKFSAPDGAQRFLQTGNAAKAVV